MERALPLVAAATCFCGLAGRALALLEFEVCDFEVWELAVLDFAVALFVLPVFEPAAAA